VTWRFPWASFARVSLACGVMALVVFALGWVLAPMRNLPRLLLLSAAGALTYALAIVGLREVSLSGVRELFSRPAR